MYSVPLIQPDLRREEAVHQIADALMYLENISTDIFRRQAHHTHTHTEFTGWSSQCLTLGCKLNHWVCSLFLCLHFHGCKYGMNMKLIGKLHCCLWLHCSNTMYYTNSLLLILFYSFSLYHYILFRVGVSQMLFQSLFQGFFHV